MKNSKFKRQKRMIRHKRVRTIVKGTKERLRLSVFRSASYIYAQLIDDASGATVLSASDLKETKSKESLVGKKASAFKVGEILAKEAKNKGIKAVVFDRGGYKYHGRVKALAEGARKGGLIF